MEDRIARLDAAVEVLSDRVRVLEARLEELEPGARATSAVSDPSLEDLAVPGFGYVPVQQWLALIGRTLVVLGGAYLLRALTEAQVLTAPVGVAIGLAYGAPWLLLAARAGTRGAQLDALCHALATALIGYPLVWEATLRFGVLGTPQSAALLGALTAAALALAAVTRLHGLAWVVTFGAFGSAAGLALATGDWVSYTMLSLGLGLATLGLGYIRQWGDLRWPAAIGANLMIIFAIDRAALSGAPAGALVLVLLAFVGYVGSFALRTLAGTHRVSAFDMAQTTAMLFIGLGGSLYLLVASGSAWSVGVAALAFGVGGYVFTFAFVERRRDVSTFFFWALFTLLVAGIGTTVCTGTAAASMVFAAAAVALAMIARHRGSLTLRLHAAICAIAAAIGSGLLATSSAALIVPPVAGWQSVTVRSVFAITALLVAVLTPTRRPLTWAARVPRLVLVSVLAWTVMGAAVLVVTRLFGDPRGMDTSVLATLRTTVLVAGILALARVARYDGGREAGWLMYPLLVATGLKLVFVDLLLGRPQTLFAALALYGVALIVAPRLLRDAGSITAAYQQRASG